MFRIAGIEKNSIVDGEGWRYVIFFQGCNHKCQGCHNPETWDFNAGLEVDDDYILSDLNEIDKDRFLDITLSGGDPFYQAKDIIPLCKKLKNLGYTLWAYTGFDFDEFMAYMNGNKSNQEINDSMIELLNYIEVVVDGEFKLSLRTVEAQYRGSSNQRLIDVEKTLSTGEIVLYELM